MSDNRESSVNLRLVAHALGCTLPRKSAAMMMTSKLNLKTVNHARLHTMLPPHHPNEPDSATEQHRLDQVNVHDSCGDELDVRCADGFARSDDVGACAQFTEIQICAAIQSKIARMEKSGLRKNGKLLCSRQHVSFSLRLL